MLNPVSLYNMRTGTEWYKLGVVIPRNNLKKFKINKDNGKLKKKKKKATPMPFENDK